MARKPQRETKPTIRPGYFECPACGSQEKMPQLKRNRVKVQYCTPCAASKIKASPLFDEI